MIDHVKTIAERNAPPAEPGDYQGEDGLLYCGRCHTRRQCYVNFLGKTSLVPCLCKCRSQQLKDEKEEMRRREALDRAETLRRQGISDPAMHRFTFDRARPTPEIQKCRRYADSWEAVCRENAGLLFWGDTGGGKTFAAACIANALIDRGIPALMTTFPRILNTAGQDGRMESVLEQVRRCALVVIDDLGAERNSDFALERVFLTVDERYKAGKPLIITTNLSLNDLRHPASMAHQRIYDRILAMCTPVFFQKGAFRADRAAGHLALARQIFESAG